MDNITKIKNILTQSDADFEVVRQEKPILSSQDAIGIYDFEKSAPVFILQADGELVAFIKSVSSGKINFAQLKSLLNCKKLEMAHRGIIEQQTGFEVGSIPLVGLNLPAIFDSKLLEYDYVYGGIGDAFVTLKIAPEDVKRNNNIIAIV